MITAAICALKNHTVALTEMNPLKEIQTVAQFDICSFSQSTQRAAGHSAEQLSVQQRQTPAALVLAEVVDTAEFAVICVFYVAQLG